LPKPVGVLLQLVWFNLKFAQKVRISQREPPPIDHTHDALAGGRIEFGDGRHIQAAFLGGSDDRERERMLTGLL
jgi:hypothetical protein